MVGMLELWLPVLVASVFVFIASSLLHMVVPMHCGDKARLSGEDDVLAAMRKANVSPGDYMFPYCTSKQWGTDEIKQKWTEGPVGFMTVRPSGPPAMGGALLQWFVYTLMIGCLVAYVAGRSLGAGADYLAVFRISGAVAFIAYAAGAPVESIWMGRKWSTSAKYVIDGLIYALVTAGAFGWLWPA